MVTKLMNTKKTDDARWEAVSAAMDNEAAAADDWAWIDDEAGRARWHSYHVIGDSLRQSAQMRSGGGLDSAALMQLAQRLQETQQDAVQTPTQAAPACPQPDAVQAVANQPFFKWFAMAASVTAVMVASWQLWSGQQSRGEVSTLSAPPSATVAAPVAAEKAVEVVPVAATAAPKISTMPVANTGKEEAEGVVPAVQKQSIAPVMPDSAK